MPNHQIVPLDTGNVLAVRFQPHSVEQREYCQLGGSVWVLQDIPGLPKRVQVAPRGEPLKVRAGEQLADAIARMLDEEDYPEQAKRSFTAPLVMLGLAGAVATWFGMYR